MKRLHMKDLRQHDVVREIEMTVEGITTKQGVILQFWRDVDTYGLREAILYLKNSNHDTTKLDAILTRITAPGKAFS